MAALLADYSAAENGAGRVVTCAGVKGVFKERLGLDYSLEGVRLILKRYGYSYGKMKTRAARVEQAFCITQTKEYLDRLEVFRAEGRVEVYLDESYVDVRMHPSRGWRQDVSATLSNGKVLTPTTPPLHRRLLLRNRRETHQELVPDPLWSSQPPRDPNHTHNQRPVLRIQTAPSRIRRITWSRMNLSRLL